MFLDRVTITIKAGDGGNGHTSFYRSKLTMNGGPDGGDGGKGGDIIFVANEGINTLYGFTFKKKFTATNGNPGEKQLKRGHDGKDVIIEVPCGTVIKDEQTGLIIADLMNHNDRFVALKGGLGGRGNNFFKSPTRQAPNFSQTGEKTPIKKVILELKTIADVGLVGFPNVGKSTLLSVISNANPKIANYPFTTLHPNLGVVAHNNTSFVVADIPGLIEGASEGAGLGHYFLRHVERVRVIVHMVDISQIDGRDAVSDYEQINTELKKYSENLANVPQIVVVTKTDLLDDDTLNQRLKNFEEKTAQKPIVMCSIIHTGVEDLLDKLTEVLAKTPKKAPQEIELHDFDIKDKTSLFVENTEDGVYEVKGGFIDNLIRGVVLSDEASNAYFQNALKKYGIIDKLKEAGMNDGDTVIIKDITFEYSE
ncbi:MAG: GTPase ObgE [Clostridiales bacterium]|nr:GTPase ObgE [Clostridiales bacterium]